jgi:ribosomal protein S18 acetylase RimI-like enzyme
MITIALRDYSLSIHPISPDELDAVLAVYRQCEDFLALGPVPTASMEMVLADIDLSKGYGALFCGIYTSEGEMIGVIDYVPSHFEGDPSAAYLSLLMIAAPFRKQGVGRAVVEAIEHEIKRNAQVDKILAGVQVNNPHAMRFWQRNGYRIVSEPKLYPDQTTAVDLRKDWARFSFQGDKHPEPVEGSEPVEGCGLA